MIRFVPYIQAGVATTLAFFTNSIMKPVYYIKQTDVKSIRFNWWGCLERQCMHLGELVSYKALTEKEIMEVHEEAIQKGYVRHDQPNIDTKQAAADPNIYSCWVNNSVGIANLVLKKLGKGGYFVEVGRKYYDAYFKRFPNKVGKLPTETLLGEFLIEGRWTGHYTHYISPSFDSYEPFLKYTELLSQRWYQHVEA